MMILSCKNFIAYKLSIGFALQDHRFDYVLSVTHKYYTVLHQISLGYWIFLLECKDKIVFCDIASEKYKITLLCYKTDLFVLEEGKLYVSLYILYFMT